MTNLKRRNFAFSLVEVVLAIGVIAFAFVAIVGVMPVGLTANRSSQAETRAIQIAQDIFAELEIQARPSPSPVTSINGAAYVDQQATYPRPTASPAVFVKSINLAGDMQVWGADSDGNLQSPYSTSLPYQVTITVTSPPATSPTPFNSSYAAQVTIRVAWQPITQNYRDFTRIFSRY